MNPDAPPSVSETGIGPDRGTFRSLPATILVLLVICALWSTYKIALIRGLDRYDSQSEVGFFWSESATHYRYYRMIGDPSVSWHTIGAALGRDTRVQYPEGVEVATHFPFGMELFYGLLHRWGAPGATPHVFLLYAICIFASLSLVMVFLLARKLTGSNTWSLGTATLYAVSTPSFIRTVRGSFLYEDFALPFLIASIALLLPSRRKVGRSLDIPVGIATGLLAGLSAALWHVSQYPLALIFIFLSLRAVIGEEGEERKRFPFGVLVGFGVAAVALPMLRNNVFLLSLPMACLVHWAAWSLMPRMRARLAVWCVSLLAVMFLFRAVSPAGSSYSHVFEYLVARVTHPFGMPQDPSAISFAARTLWEYSFMSADASDIVGGLRFGLIFLPFMIPPLLIKREWRGGLAPLCGTALVLLILGLMMRRFLVLAMPFVAVASVTGFAVWWLDHPSLLSQRPWRAQLLRAWPVAALVLILAAIATVPRRVTEPAGRPGAQIQALCDWVNKNTEPDDAFFAPISISAAVLLHTDRPSLVHPIWEWPSSRDKYEKLLTAAYGDEESFWTLLRTCKAAYFIYDFTLALPEGGGSMRYIAGTTGPLDDSWTVTKCQFAPKSLRCFDLVWQNGVFRVFRLRRPTETAPADRDQVIDQLCDDEYDPMFDPRNFERGEHGYVNTLALERRIVRANRLFNQGALAVDVKDWTKAEAFLRLAIQECPNHLGAYLELAYLEHLQKRPALELQALKEALRIVPLNREVKRRMQHLETNPPAEH